MAQQRSISSPEGGSRYRALLDFSGVAASEPNLQGVLERTFALLSRLIPPGLIALLLLDEKRGLTTLHFVRAGSEHPAIAIGTELSLKGSAVWRAIDQQTPVLVEDAQPEINRFPDVAARLKSEPIQSLYVFPVSTSRRKLGVLIAWAPTRHRSLKTTSS
jgi:GAF domain-containing protein